MKLREYQSTAIVRIKEKFKEGKKRVVFRLSTGGGKSVVFTYMAVEAIKRGRSVLIIADRWELMTQAQGHLKRNGINPMMINPDWKGQIAPCYVASIQTLNRRNMPEADLVIIDEAHINAFSRVLNNHIYDQSFIVGLTATPISTSKFNLSEFYHDMVEVIEINELIEKGFLVNAKYFGAWENFGKLKTRGDDYDADELFQKFDKKTMYAGMIDAYQEHTPNTKAICFCINVDHTIRTAREFNERGIKATFVVSDTSLCSEQERRDAFEQFETADATGRPTAYPPYNIVKLGQHDYAIEIAVAGFAQDEIDITAEGNKLVIEGKVKAQANGEYLHKGIATRDFKHQFTLAETVVVRNADVLNGMLVIRLENVIPEEKLPRKIMIGDATKRVVSERLAA